MLKTLVTFLIATPSPVWLLVAALQFHGMSKCVEKADRSKTWLDGCPTWSSSKSMTLELSDVPYYAISSLSQFLGYVVSLVNDEVLVEDLEDLAALEISHFVSV